MILRKGSQGSNVIMLQEYLGIHADGDFGKQTDNAVRRWQKTNNLKVDGIVGPNTWDAMGLASSDISESVVNTSDLNIIQHFLPTGEYKIGPTKKEYLFIHHTAGWHNPYNVINQWATDKRGSIGTEFVIGGQSIKNGETKYDGNILQAIPEGGYAWHLGNNGSQYMHTHSVGIEVCNFGYIINGKTYAGTTALDKQIVTLDEAFRGYKDWHKYSDKQISSLEALIKHIGERDNIDIRDGLVASIKKDGVSAFGFNEDAYYGRVKGLWTHTNLRRDKTDMFPQQELIDMLMSL